MEIAPRYGGPPLLAIGEPADLLTPVVRQRRRVETTLASLSVEQWAAPTRCDGWSVQDVAAHLAGVNRFWQASVTAGAGGAPTRLLDGFDPASTPEVMVDPMRALAPADVLELLVSSNDGFLGALGDLDDGAWSLLAESPAGHVPIRLVAAHALWDSWVHERDVSLPLGLAPDAAADEVAWCLRYAAALAPGFALMNGQATAGTFAVEATDPELALVVEVGESVVVGAGAAPPGAPRLRGDAVSLVEALSIRSPLPTSAPAEWRRLLVGLARAFDTDLDLSAS